MVWIISFLFVLSSAFAEVGKVTKVIGNDAYLMRGSEKLMLAPELPLEEGDELNTETSYTVIYLYPGTQVSLAKNTKLKLEQNTITEEANLEQATSVIDLARGIIRLLVTKSPDQEIDQKVKTSGASFAVRGTEFEVSVDDENEVNLEVVEGQVEASSPYIQSFVPEYVRANEGLTFNRKARKFSRRKFRERFRAHPGFMKKDEIRKRWELHRAKRLMKKKSTGMKVNKTSRLRKRGAGRRAHK